MFLTDIEAIFAIMTTETDFQFSQGLKTPLDLSLDENRELTLWRALSDLFLDTELQNDDYAFIARRLNSTSLPSEFIHQFLHRKVAPALMPNLWSMTGEWAGFSDKYLLGCIAYSNLQDISFGPSWWRRVNGTWSYAEGEWQKLLPRLQIQSR